MLPLQVADFSGDQLQDIMMMTYDGLYGWAQVTHDSKHFRGPLIHTMASQLQSLQDLLVNSHSRYCLK